MFAVINGKAIFVNKIKNKPKGMRDFDQDSRVLLQVTMNDCFENFRYYQAF